MEKTMGLDWHLVRERGTEFYGSCRFSSMGGNNPVYGILLLIPGYIQRELKLENSHKEKKFTLSRAAWIFQADYNMKYSSDGDLVDAVCSKEE